MARYLLVLLLVVLALALGPTAPSSFSSRASPSSSPGPEAAPGLDGRPFRAKTWGVDAFKRNLEKLAELAIRVGLNLEKGQEVIATAPIEAVDFVRLLAEKAYREGRASSP